MCSLLFLYMLHKIECNEHINEITNPKNPALFIDEEWTQEILQGNLMKISIGKNINKIAKKAFYGKNLVIEIDMSRSQVEIIDQEAFRFCSNLKKFMGCSSLMLIKEYAFDSCINLETIEGINNVELILDYAFCGTKIAQINLGKNIQDFQKSAFKQCNHLENIYVSSMYFSNINDDGIVYSLHASIVYFFPPRKGGVITFAKNVESISRYAFNNCYLVKGICIPDIRNICDRAFINCNNLKYIHFGPNLLVIEPLAFIGIFNLHVFYSGEAVPNVAINAFDEAIKVFTWENYSANIFGPYQVIKVKKLNSFHKMFFGEKFCHCGIKGKRNTEGVFRRTLRRFSQRRRRNENQT